MIPTAATDTILGYEPLTFLIVVLVVIILVALLLRLLP